MNENIALNESARLATTATGSNGQTTVPETIMPEVLYFGSMKHGGHYLQSTRIQDNTCTRPIGSQPWGSIIDSGLASVIPKLKEGNGWAESYRGVHLYHKAGWTALAFWDQSGDSRPGSNTVFLAAIEKATIPQIIRWAQVQWPRVFERFNFPLRSVDLATDYERFQQTLNPPKPVESWIVCRLIPGWEVRRVGGVDFIVARRKSVQPPMPTLCDYEEIQAGNAVEAIANSLAKTPFR